MGLTNFPYGITSFGVPVLGGIGGLPFTGNWWFVDPVNGLDGNAGTSPSQALQTLYQAHNKAVAGNNDVVVLIGNGASSGTARLSLANAQSITPAATAGTLNWSKNATHLIGIAAPNVAAPRARMAPPATYSALTFSGTAATVSFNMVNVTAAGCLFANFEAFCGFSTDGLTTGGGICWRENGGRNTYVGVSFSGMGDATMAAIALSRSLVVNGTGENYFQGCTIGLDTVLRATNANASLEFTGGTPRNRFVDCDFPMYVSDVADTAIYAGTGGIDRVTRFDNCRVLNTTGSGSSSLTGAIQMAATGGGPNGNIFWNKSSAVGVTHLCYDATTAAQVYVDGGAPTNSTSGQAVISTDHP